MSLAEETGNKSSKKRRDAAGRVGSNQRVSPRFRLTPLIFTDIDARAARLYDEKAVKISTRVEARGGGDRWARGGRASEADSMDG